MDTNTLTGLLTVILPTVIGWLKKLFNVTTDVQVQLLISVVSFVTSLILELSTRPFVSWLDLAGRAGVLFLASQVWYDKLYRIPVLSKIAGN